MAFEKLKKQQQMPVPRANHGPMAAPAAPRPKPSLAAQAGQMAMSKGMDMALNKGAEALFGKAAAGAAGKAAAGAAAGAGAKAAGAAALANPVTAPLAIAGMALPKLMGK